MAIKFQCPGCGMEDVAADTLGGGTVACGECGQEVRLPVPAAPGESIRFRCDGCGKSMAAPAHLAGKKITCKACGRTGVKIPGTPGATTAPAPPKPRPAPAPPIEAAAPSAVDIYGLDEAAPASPSRGGPGGDDLFADARLRPASAPAKAEPEEVLPSRKAFEPMTDEKKKKIAKRAEKIRKTQPSFAGAGMGVSFGTILMITLFLWRLYRIGHRVTRGLDDRADVGASAPFEPGTPLDPKEAAAEGDREVARMLKEPGAAEAREWLDAAKHPNHGVFEMGNERARAMVAGFYERGAKRVSVLDASPIGDVVVTSMIAVELPDEPDRRKQCLDWEVQYLEGEDPTKDLGQKYLMITTD